MIKIPLLDTLKDDYKIPSYILIRDKSIEVYDVCMSAPSQMPYYLFPNIFDAPRLSFKFMGTNEALSDIPYVSDITLVMDSNEFFITNVRIQQTTSTIVFPESARHGNIETSVEITYDKCYISLHEPKMIRGFFADVD